jgi:sphingolipid delta-4 desaturase
MTGFLHPLMLGIVLGISHFHGTRKYQPSASNYNRLINLLTFNAGLHVEHHDIAGVPWFRLWKLRRMAPEFYDDLEVIPSYTMLGLKFVFCSPTTFVQEFDNETQRNIRRFMDEAAEENWNHGDTQSRKGHKPQMDAGPSWSGRSREHR